MICAMLSIGGGHWLLFQTVAWAQMFYGYAQEVPISQAVSMTFDGEHPCDICIRVKEGRKNEKQMPIAVKRGPKSELFTVFSSQLLQPPFSEKRKYFVLQVGKCLERVDAPPRPVPKNHQICI